MNISSFKIKFTKQDDRYKDHSNKHFILKSVCLHTGYLLYKSDDVSFIQLVLLGFGLKITYKRKR
jgi:hypothetical protein